MGVILMADVYRRCFVDPYPNGWKNDPNKTTPVDAEALQPFSDALKELDMFFDGFDKSKAQTIKKKVLTKAQWNALPDTKYNDGVIYFITDGGSGPIAYPNYETEAF